MWHFDSDGKRKPNPYRNQLKLGDINKLTTRRFERICQQSGFRIARRVAEPFTGRPKWLKRILAKFFIPDLLCSCFIYELEKLK
jgi:hypothetical protein